jgi:HAD superfamily hydrolase (TIGR01509 family)
VIDAVIFDVDGVLVDSEPLWEQVRRRVVAQYGGRWALDAQARLMGMSTAEWSAYMSEELGVSLTAKEVADVVIARMSEAYAAHVPLMPGAVDAVHRMAESWPIGLASSSPASLIEVVVRVAGLQPLVAAAVSTEEVARGKPAPDVYLRVTRLMDVRPDRSVAVEDSSNGLRSAAAAGLVPIAIPNPRYPLAADALKLAPVHLGSLTDLTVARIAAL